MKKEIIIRGMLLVAMLFVLCNHNVCAQKDIYGGEVKLTDAEEYALKKPGVRASGKGVSSREAAALSRARLEARAAFAEAIASSVLSAAKASGFDLTRYAGDEEEGQEMTDGGEKQNNLLKSKAQEIISGSPVVKMNKFFNKKTRKYTIFVCLEYNGDVAKLAKEVSKTIKDSISEEDRLKIEYSLEKFEREIENNLENGNGDEVQGNSEE